MIPPVKVATPEGSHNREGSYYHREGSHPLPYYKLDSYPTPILSIKIKIKQKGQMTPEIHYARQNLIVSF